MMRRSPYLPGQAHDAGLGFLVRSTKAHMVESEDDALYVITGPPGSGKSMLAMHLVSLYSESPSADQFALTQEGLARAHGKAVEQFHKGVPDRFVVYDEADVGRRSSITEWNKDMLSLYMTNRVFGILHLWCWPSLHLLDQAFVQERIAGVFVVISKERNRPRRYVFFPKASILKLIEDNTRLTIHNLKRAAPKHAYYMGWFKKYEGPLIDAYKTVKVDAASEISNGFSTKYGGKEGGESAPRCTVQDIAKMERCSVKTVRRRIEQGLKEGLLDPSVCSSVGMYSFSAEQREQVREWIRNPTVFDKKAASTKAPMSFVTKKRPHYVNRVREEEHPC